MTDRRIVYVSPFRRRAREVERQLQEAIEERDGAEGLSPVSFRLLAEYGIEDWAHGVRVERAGLFQHAVVATEERGH